MFHFRAYEGSCTLKQACYVHSKNMGVSDVMMFDGSKDKVLRLGQTVQCFSLHSGLRGIAAPSGAVIAPKTGYCVPTFAGLHEFFLLGPSASYHSLGFMGKNPLGARLGQTSLLPSSSRMVCRERLASVTERTAPPTWTQVVLIVHP